MVARVILLFILAGATEALMSYVRGYLGFPYSILIGFVIFFLLCYWSIRWARTVKPAIIFVSLFLGVSALLLPPRFIDFQGSLVSFPDLIFHSLGVVAGFAFYMIKSSKRWIVAGLGLAATLFMFFKGYSMWLHKLNFDSYTGRYFARLPEFTAEDDKGNVVSNLSVAGKVVLMDVWHTRCGACFRKFPALNELYLKYKDNDKVKIYAVNYPNETDRPTQAFEMITKRGYSFPVAKLKTVSVLDSLSVTVFPTTFLVNEKGYVVFKGSLENGIKYLERIIKK
jgi:thiol-disulfide isomerase/thioredoxin